MEALVHVLVDVNPKETLSKNDEYILRLFIGRAMEASAEMVDGIFSVNGSQIDAEVDHAGYLALEMLEDAGVLTIEIQ